LLKGTLILLVDGNPKEKSFLPIYLENMAYIRYDERTRPEMRSYLESAARERFPELTFNGQVPDGLKGAVNEDNELRQALEEAFTKIESNPNTPPGGVTFLKDLDPGRNLASWYTFYPYNVVRISWRKIGEDNRYHPKDLMGQPLVYAANDRFFEMFNIATDAETFNPEEEKLTGEILAARLRADGAVDPQDFSAWTDDQQKLGNQIVFRNGFSRARIALRFNEQHPNPEFQNRAYFPSLVGKRIVGDKRRPHTVYLLVVFIELPSIETAVERIQSHEHLACQNAA
jgi:hypothetical protein